MPQTKEELEKQIADAQKLLEEMPDPEDAEDQDDQDNSDNDDSDDQNQDQDQDNADDDKGDVEDTDQGDDTDTGDEDDSQDQDEDEDKGDEDKDKKDKKGQDYQEKFRQSSSEAQRLADSKKQLEDAIDEAYNTPEPTEDELKGEFSEWDTLSDFEKRMAKENLHNKVINQRIRDIRSSHREAETKIQDYVKKVDVFSIHPDTLKKYPTLEGKQEDLKKFAARPERITLDLDDLVELFLVKTAKTTKNKGRMFETGTRGGEDRRSNDTGMITLEEANKLMRTNYPEYKRLLKAKKINFNVA